MDKSFKEQWKIIEEYPNYEVSNFGHIRTKSRKLIDKKNNKKLGRNYSLPKLRRTQLDKDGYELVTLSKDGKKLGKRVHRLVAIAFLDNPNNLPQINHKDGIKTNNMLDNLEWSSEKDNINHAFRTGLHHGIGESHVYNILTTEQVILIRKLWNNKLSAPISQTNLAKQFGVSRGCISNIVYNKTWKHIL